MSLLVSIHDVTPALADGVMRLWSLCAERGVRPALFVVPNWHGAWPLDAHPVFVAWLRARADDGAEIVLHGDRHDEVGLPRRLGDRLRARLRTVGLDPVGFVPPAWLARPEGHDAAGDAGLAFTEDDRAIHLYPSRRRVASPVVRWSARTSARAVGSVAVARARLALQSGAAFPRVAFHPQDLVHPVTARALGPTLDRWLARHPAVAYRALSP